MAFVIPEFPLLCNIWDGGGSFPPLTIPMGPPRETDIECNLAWGKRVNVVSSGGTGQQGVPIAAMTLLLPLGTTIHGPEWTNGPDVVEVPKGSGRWYWVAMQDLIGAGFSNAHQGAMIFAMRFQWT